MKARVLVTGAGALLGQGIIRALRQTSPEVHITAVDPSPLAAGLYWADRHHRIPLAADDAYTTSLERVIEQERPDVLLVGTDAELPLLSRARPQIESKYDTRVLVSDPQVVAIADDKYLTYEFLRDAGFDPPATALPAGATQLADQVGFPLTVKPRIGARSVGVRVAHNAAELEEILSRGGNDVVQEHVGTPDTEYTAGAVHFDSEPVISIVMRRDLRDGNTYRAYAHDYPELRERVVEYARALRPYGPANFQFRIDAAGKPRVFEINARFSGTTPLRHLAGFPEVDICLRHVLSGEPLAQPAIRPVTILRFWSELVVPAGDVPE